MGEYRIDLVESRVVELQIKLIPDQADTLNSQVTANYHTKIQEPLDASDPTVLLATDVEIIDEITKNLSMKFKMMNIFSFDPIPDNRKLVAKAECATITQRKAIEYAQKILNAMGQNIEFS